MTIVSTPSVRSGSPLVNGTRINGTRINVMDVHTHVVRFEHHPATVADKFDIQLAGVYEALAYYYSNPKEMRAEREEIEEARQRVRENSLLPPD